MDSWDIATALLISIQSLLNFFKKKKLQFKKFTCSINKKIKLKLKNKKKSKNLIKFCSKTIKNKMNKFKKMANLPLQDKLLQIEEFC